MLQPRTFSKSRPVSKTCLCWVALCLVTTAGNLPKADGQISRPLRPRAQTSKPTIPTIAPVISRVSDYDPGKSMRAQFRQQLSKIQTKEYLQREEKRLQLLASQMLAIEDELDATIEAIQQLESAQTTDPSPLSPDQRDAVIQQIRAHKLQILRQVIHAMPLDNDPEVVELQRQMLASTELERDPFRNVTPAISKQQWLLALSNLNQFRASYDEVGSLADTYRRDVTTLVPLLDAQRRALDRYLDFVHAVLEIGSVDGDTAVNELTSAILFIRLQTRTTQWARDAELLNWLQVYKLWVKGGAYLQAEAQARQRVHGQQTQIHFLLGKRHQLDLNRQQLLERANGRRPSNPTHAAGQNELP